MLIRYRAARARASAFTGWAAGPAGAPRFLYLAGVLRRQEYGGASTTRSRTSQSTHTSHASLSLYFIRTECVLYAPRYALAMRVLV
jgi:hypothetical protein